MTLNIDANLEKIEEGLKVLKEGQTIKTGIGANEVSLTEYGYALFNPVKGEMDNVYSKPEEVIEKLKNDMENILSERFGRLQENEFERISLRTGSEIFVQKKEHEFIARKNFDPQTKIYALGNSESAAKTIVELGKGNMKTLKNMIAEPSPWRELPNVTLRDFLEQYNNMPNSNLKAELLDAQIEKFRYHEDRSIEINFSDFSRPSAVKLQIERDMDLNGIGIKVNDKIIGNPKHEHERFISDVSDYGNIHYNALYGNERGQLFYRNVKGFDVKNMKAEGITFAAHQKSDGTFNVAYKQADYEMVNQLTQQKIPQINKRKFISR